jgi:hypothetical protein
MPANGRWDLTRRLKGYWANCCAFEGIKYPCNSPQGQPRTILADIFVVVVNPLTPNDLYMSRTAPLTSKVYILYICSTNIGTEYFKHALNSPVFSSSKCSLFRNANLFSSCIIHILYTECAEIKKK